MKRIVGLVRLIHSLATESALEQLRRHADPATEALVEVNLSGEPTKAGIAPGGARRVHRRVARADHRPDDDAAVRDRPRGVAPVLRPPRRARRGAGLARLSMGTSQDWPVAVEEGATIIRLGTSLYT